MVSTMRFLVCLLALLSVFNWTAQCKMAQYQIRTEWNGTSLSAKQYVNISLSYETDLTIDVSSPFYDDPKLPDMTNKPGTMDKLYEYEVVEVFLLGPDEHYLEIELGPRGQYLLLELKGYRQTVRSKFDLKRYHSRVESGEHGWQWRGQAVVAHTDLPRNITRFNAYAIHGSGEKRTYLSLFPAPANNSNYTQPDFHRLELFQPISIFTK